jgi:copper chaperone
MWGFNKKKQTKNEKQAVFFIDGMHCPSCSLNVDGALEDLPGVISSSTGYAQGKSTVRFNPEMIKTETMVAAIEELGYKISKIQ